MLVFWTESIHPWSAQQIYRLNENNKTPLLRCSLNGCRVNSISVAFETKHTGLNSKPGFQAADHGHQLFRWGRRKSAFSHPWTNTPRLAAGRSISVCWVGKLVRWWGAEMPWESSRDTEGFEGLFWYTAEGSSVVHRRRAGQDWPLSLGKGASSRPLKDWAWLYAWETFAERSFWSHKAWQVYSLRISSP